MLKSLWNDAQFKLSTELLILGRNEKTEITSLKCSRQQVSVQLLENCAKIVQLGPKCSFVNDRPLNTGSCVALKNGDVVKLTQQHSYQFVCSEEPKIKVDPDREKTSEISENVDESKMWRSCGSENSLLIYTTEREAAKKIDNLKIAGFDLDGTLIKTKSGQKFPTDEDDWMPLFDENKIRLKFENLIQNGYKIVLFTNQKGVGMGKIGVEPFKLKIQRIVQLFGVPMSCYIALKDGFFRKPMTGMWDEMMQSHKNATLNIAECFYVGDAAGRPEVKKQRKKDHSCADRLFAINLNIKFSTPEEFFLGLKKIEPFEMPVFDPKRTAYGQPPPLEPPSASTTSSAQEIILLVGYPASGKSTFAQQNFSQHKNYVIINQDTLKTAKKCLQVAEEALKLGKSVIVDNTNPDVETRSKFTKLAQCQVRCFWMNGGLEQAKHNNKFRQLAGLSDDQHKNVDDIVLYSYRKKFQEPTKSEGFSEIVRINFAPNFQNPDHKLLYSKYLLEK